MEHKIALVTGATSGLGQAAARLLAAEDVMQIQFEGLGRPLRNQVRSSRSAPTLADVIPIG